MSHGKLVGISLATALALLPACPHAVTVEAASVGAATNCGSIVSLRMMKVASGNYQGNYAVVVTSAPKVIAGTASYVGANDSHGGFTYLRLPEDDTEKSLVWASLERALHNPEINLIWKNATAEYLFHSGGNWDIIVNEWSVGRPY